MKREVTTAEWVQYIRQTFGCRNIDSIAYELHDSEDGDVLLEGRIPVTQQGRLMVMGRHPSGNKYGSVVGAMLDIVDPAIKSFLRQRMDNKVLMQTGAPASTTQQGEMAKRVKAIVWQVTHIDDDEKIVYVYGVV